MTREEAIEIAEQYVADKGLNVGPVCNVRFFSGEEFFESEIRPPPHWCVYLSYSGPSLDKLYEERRELLSGSYNEPTIVIVEDTSREARLFISL